MERYEYRGEPPTAEFVAKLAQERDEYSRAMMEEDRRANRLQAQLEAVEKHNEILEAANKVAHERIAQLEAVRRERDRWKESAEAHEEDHLIIGSLTDHVQSLQSSLDAERTQREQVEMANYAKDGQIETLQAERDRLRANLINCSERLAAYYGDNYPAVVDARAALTPAAGGTRHGV